MIKILLIILLVVGIYFFVRKIGSKNTQETHSKKPNCEEIMLECKKCGIYISSKEAVLITLRHQREIKLLVELYKNKVLESKTPMTDKEFLKYWKELPDDK